MRPVTQPYVALQKKKKKKKKKAKVRMEDLDPNSVEYLTMKQQDLSNKFKDENARRNFLQLERVSHHAVVSVEH